MNKRNVRLLFGLTIAVVIAIVLFARAPRVQADSEVTDCTEPGLSTALIGGGTITFNCNGTHAPATIYFASTLTLSGSITLDGSNGGNTVALDGAFARRIFSITVDSQLTLLNLILQNGDDADGGCLYANGAVKLNNVEAWNCQAFGGKRGGVLFVNSMGSATLVNARLHDNLAGYAGGAVYSLGTLTITNSNLTNNTVFITGGGGTDGGGIWTGGTARIDSTTFLSNTTTAGYGGGLYNQGMLTMTNSVLNANFATANGGGIQTYLGTTTLTNVTVISNSTSANGGGLSTYQGTYHLSNMTVMSNSAPNVPYILHNGIGGGIYNDSGTITLTNVTVSRNQSWSGGGGLEINRGAVTLNNVTVSGNSTSESGGGLETLFGTATLNNTTLSGNSAVGGGGINTEYGTITLTNVTVSGNSASQSGGGMNNLSSVATLDHVTFSGNSAGAGFPGGGIVQAGQLLTQTITVANSIIANSTAGENCYINLADLVSITIVSQGYNLSNDGLCPFNQPTDMNAVPPILGPLANNGGSTLTHLPLASSPAIDAIPPGINGCGTTLTTDQRGAPRPINGKCDIGAVEAGAYPRLWLPLIRR